MTSSSLAALKNSEMKSQLPARRLAAILAADVVGYSRLIGRDEEGTLARMKAIRLDLIDRKIADHHGRMVKTIGDGILVEFQSVIHALRCANEMQAALAERNAELPAERRIDWRIGINVGDIVVEDGDIFGDGVKYCGRTRSVGDPVEPGGGQAFDRRSDQGRVWDEVARQSEVHSLHSETAALDDVQGEFELRIAEELDRVAPAPDQIGLVCTIGDEVVGLDLFDKPSTLAQVPSGNRRRSRSRRTEIGGPTRNERCHRTLPRRSRRHPQEHRCRRRSGQRSPPAGIRLRRRTLL